MSGARWPRRMVRLGLLGVAAMTLAAPGILLARGTTGHDWYAARKLTIAEAMLAVGFSKYTTVAYRRADGNTWNIIRAAVAEFPSAVRARQRILGTIGDGVMLGAGVGGTVFCLMLFGAAGHGRRRPDRDGPGEPVEYPHRHSPVAGPTGRIADWVRPGLRARIALLVVSPAELERLCRCSALRDVQVSSTSQGRAAWSPLRPTAGCWNGPETPSLPPTGNGDQGTKAAVRPILPPGIPEPARTKRSRTIRPGTSRSGASARRTRSSTDGRLDRRHRLSVPGRQLLRT